MREAQTLKDLIGVSNAREGLEGDGVSGYLFDLLWKKDLLSSLSVALRIPDTVLYRFQAPVCWYFTSVDGTIKRKTKGNLNNDRVYEEFVRKSSPSGIVAYYVRTKKPNILSDEPEGDKDDQQTTIEYLDVEGLRDFLFNRQHGKEDGILQKFVHPKGDNNNMIRVLWSPKICLVDRKVNKRNVNDSRFNMYERAVTFEGADFHSDVHPVRGSSLIQNLQGIAESLVNHVGVVTAGRIVISRLALNFKTDKKDRVWLLFASSIRLQDELSRFDKAIRENFKKQGLCNSPLDMNVLKVPDNVRQAQPTSSRRPARLTKSFECPTCAGSVDVDSIFNVSYRVLISYEERRMGIGTDPATATVKSPASEGAEPSEESNEDAPVAIDVPGVFRRIHPRLTIDEYIKYRQDVAFLYKEAVVCEDCYLLFSSPQLGEKCWNGQLALKRAAVSDDVSDEISSGLKRSHSLPVIGTQDLNPDKLRERRYGTQKKIEALREAEDLLWDPLAARAAKLSRIRSCPMKMPAPGPRLWPPPPVLQRPLPPTEPETCSAYYKRWAVIDAASSAPRGIPRNLPKLKGDPYLRELQSFMSQCGERATEVLGPIAANSYDRITKRVKIQENTAAATEDIADTQASQVVSESKPVPSSFGDFELSDCIEDDEESAGVVEYCTDGWPWQYSPGDNTPTTRTPSRGEEQPPSQWESRAGSRPSSRTSSHIPRPPPLPLPTRSSSTSALSAERGSSRPL